MTARPFDTAAHRRKRVRFDTDNSSEPSISDESALASTNAADDSTVASDYDSNSNSELSESSEEPSSESSSEDEEDDAASDMDLEEQQGEDGVVNVRIGKKPTMKLDKDELGPDIGSFLKEFLPQLKAANDELEAQRKAGTLDSKMIDAGEEEDAEQYIEMDLGLGVLEEKDPNADDDSSNDSDDTLDGNEKEKDVLGKLMGRTNSKKPVVVQEVGTAPEP